MAIADNTAWYRKYRPRTIEDYMGDDIKHIVESRFNKPESMPQVMMLYGTRGCGKTSFARIIAKYYLCENKIDGKPCEQCEICEGINDTLISGEIGIETEGVTEIDATVASGKDAIQQIIEDSIIPPLYTKYKILILDEAHMITPQAQNSMLKVIEDIPKHLVVIFCTTDEHKVLGTVHSRCQIKLEIKKKTEDEIADRLLYIAEKEGVKTSLKALKIIAKKADRVPRESINLFESIAKNYSNEVTVENVRAMTGDVASEIYMEYFKAAGTGLEDILDFNNKLKELDIEAEEFISGLTRFVLDCMYIKHAIALEDYPIEYVKQVKELFDEYNSNEFDALLQIIEYANRSIGVDTNKNELMLITTAMRIGKIGLISEGLGEESAQAESENKKSISNYRDTKDKESKEQIENAKTHNLSKELFANIIDSISDVSNDSKIELVADDNDVDTEENEGFFSAKELNSMLSTW